MQQLSKTSIRILDFDSSLTRQKKLIEKYKSPPYSLQHIDLLDLGLRVRGWANKHDINALRRELNLVDKNKLTFFGSSDFHHISSLLIEQFQEDFCVVVFDFHPDLDSLPPSFSCGSWVNLCARQQAVKKIIQLGPSSQDLDFTDNFTFNFSWFKDSRIEIYPYYHQPSRMLFKNLRNNHFIHTKPAGFFQEVSWQNLKDENIGQFISALIDRLPSKNAYISIDKDCLIWDDAVTNWEPGLVKLDWLLSALQAFKDKANIIGADVCGDYSPIKATTPFKKFCISWDHPKQSAEEMNPEKINEINQAANLRITDLLLR